MADFRRLFFALAVVALLISSATTASAQTNFACTASASTPIIRAEGLTELVGDITLTCTGGSLGAGSVLPQYGISVNSSSATNPITNLITDTGTLGANPFVDAALVVGTAPPYDVSQLQTGAAVGALAITGNTFQGRRTTDTTITFNNIPLTPGSITIRISGIRVLAGGAPITFFITTTRLVANTGELTVTNNFFNVGVPQTGLAFTPLSASGGTFSLINVLQCAGLNTGFSNTSTGTTSATFVVQFREQQVNAFKPLAQEHATLNTGTAVINGTLPTGYGLATNGTRLTAVFTNIPAGVRVFVTVAPISTGSTTTYTAGSAVLVNSDANGANLTAATVNTTAGTGTVAGTNTGAVGALSAEIIVSGGTAVATWEILLNNTGASENLAFGVLLRSPSNITVTGTAQLAGSFAPTAPGGSGRVSLQAATALSQIPRFATGTPADAFTLVACVTNLLFPFVTSQAGFDTGLAITNASLDPGAPLFTANNSQAGTCTVNFYGNVTTNPTSRTTTSIPAGKSATFLLGGPNVGNPDAYGMPDAPAANFAGYVIASCSFRFGHGFAFITDAHRNNFGAMGYLALVMDAAAASRTTSAGENLGN